MLKTSRKMAKIKITVEGYRCERCGHEWIPRQPEQAEPTVCPACKSPYWNKPKQKKSSIKNTF